MALPQVAALRAEFRILGPVGVSLAGEPVSLTGKQRALLGCLLLEANHVVSMERIIDCLWGEDTPVSAAARVRALVAELRRALLGGGGCLVETRSPGYLLHVGDGELDSAVFVDQVEAAGRAALAGQPEQAVGRYGQALALWGGTPLDGLAGPHVVAEVARLSEHRAAALEGRAEAMLALGRLYDAVAELARLTTEQPFREKPCGLLMRGLYQSGRSAEALAAYQKFRNRLVNELGVEPGDELRRLHQRILRGTASSDSVVPAVVVPRHLPADTGRFVGRKAQLARLDALKPGSSRVLLVVGPAGAGKTTLAVHWAHRTVADFPDGQLFLTMRGFDTGQRMSSAEALPLLLQALGQPRKDIPVDSYAQEVLYRSLLAGRRVLVVLDNVASPVQVRPLLPGAPGCLVVITSRDRLDGLVARDGASRITVDALRPEESLSLLAHSVGVERLHAELADATRLAAQCGHMPLALSIAGARLADQVHHTVGEYAAELVHRGVLARLAAPGDEHTAVRAALALSYQALPTAARSMFRLMSLAPSSGLDSRAVAALAGVSLIEAEDLLDAIAQVHLITEDRAHHFGYHDLLFEYATERAAEEDSEAERRQATHRLMGYYLRSVVAATRVCGLRGIELPYDAASSDVAEESFCDEPHALGWLDASWDEITAVIALAEEARPDPHPVSWLLVAALRDFMHHRRPLVEWVRIATTALAAARRAGEETGQAAMHLSLGTVRWRMAELPAAEHDFEQALALSQRAGWTKGEADALRGIGVVLKQLGRPREALPRYLDSVELDRRMGDRHGEAAGLNNLASAYHTLGKLDQAEDCLSACLHLVEMADDQYKVALTLVNLGLVHQEQGRLDDSLRCLDRSFVLARGSDLRYAEAITWEALGRVHNDAGRWAEAAKAHQKALVAASAVENRNCQVDSLVGLAEAETGRDDPDRALDHLDAAAEVIELTGYRTGRVEVLIGLARVNCRLGRHDQAYEDAVSALWLAQDGSPLTLSRAHHTLAEVLLELGDGAQADRECRQAAQLARRSGQLLAHARVLVALGHIHRRLGHERGARLAWRRAHLVFADLDIPRQAETASLLR